MPAGDRIQVAGTVIELLDREACRVELANGHRAICRSLRGQPADFQIGDRVTLELHPADLSRGRITGRPS